MFMSRYVILVLTVVFAFAGTPAVLSVQASPDGTQIEIPCPGYDAGGVLREKPSFSAKIVKELPGQFPESIEGVLIDGPLCTDNGGQSCSNITYDIWFEVNIDGVIGWNTPCDQPNNSNAPSLPTDLAQISTEVPPNTPNTEAELWYTSISQCNVDPLIYEFYKDKENILKLVVANPRGIWEIIENVLDHIGFWIDAGKTKFEPTADEVKATLFYSSLDNYKAQIDRYSQGKLLSSDTSLLDQTEYQDLLNKLGCGVNA